MSEAVLSLLDAVDPTKDSHEIGFYGNETLPDRYITQCRDLGIEHRFFRKTSGTGFSSWVEIYKWLQKGKPEVVICHMTQPLPALLAYRLLNRKATILVVEHHSNDLKTFKDWFLTLTNHWFSHQTVYLTEDYERQVSNKLGAFYNKKKVSVIGNAINTDLFAPIDSRVNSDFIIGMQARMVPGKDFETLFRSFQLIREQSETVKLEIAGDGPERSKLEGLARELGIVDDVTFLGMMDQSSLAETMKTWQVLVLATSGETMSRAVMEGQALGLVVVATDVGGTKATIQDNVNGLLVPPKSPECLAEKLLYLKDHPTLRATISKNASRMAHENFSPTSRWEQYSKLIFHSLDSKLVKKPVIST